MVSFYKFKQKRLLLQMFRFFSIESMIINIPLIINIITYHDLGRFKRFYEFTQQETTPRDDRNITI